MDYLQILQYVINLLTESFKFPGLYSRFASQLGGMFHRNINIPISRSFFLFGARGTGKSTLLRELFPKELALWIDLLDPVVEEAFAIDPGRLRRQVLALPASISHVVIDEIQKAPPLLDVVHGLIENDRVPQHFVLTGSSARKLKAGGANLLAGRAIVRHLFPLFDSEIDGAQEIESTLRWG